MKSISFAVRHHLALRENRAIVVTIMSPRKATAEMAAAMDSIVSMNRINYAPSPRIADRSAIPNLIRSLILA